MVASQIADRIGNDNRGVGAPLWEAGWTTDVEVEARDADLWQADIRVNPIVDIKIERIELQVRREGDVNAIEPKARFIGQIWTKDVRFVQREYLSLDCRVSPKPGSVFP